MKRPSLDETYLTMLTIIARRGTCVRRQVAAILVDDKGRVISTGYNGVPPGFTHCTDTPCDGADEAHGTTEKCMATHAEANAIIQAGLTGGLASAATMYCSASPCFGCAKMIASTNVKRVVYIDAYADQRGLELLREARVACVHAILMGKGESESKRQG